MLGFSKEELQAAATICIDLVEPSNLRFANIFLRHGAGNMVNGILWKLVLLMESNSLPLPKVESDDRTQARALVTLYSHPIGKQWEKFSRAKLVTKLNLLKGLCTKRKRSRTDLLAFDFGSLSSSSLKVLYFVSFMLRSSPYLAQSAAVLENLAEL
ncbi:hypothetical protein M0R45_016537 [Rubus argutus]|uniref:Uncharacterized protein n=1 Tax=Rubus argutus TaxID=59490 RepID=A0AAW1XVB9_RUBAR